MRDRVLSFVFVAAAVAAVAFAVLVGLVWWGQERIVFQPPGLAGVGDLRPNVRQVHYRAADGQELFAYVVQPAAVPRGVLIAFHGNADLAGWQLPWAAEVAARTGWAVFLAEYRGYDGLPGVPTYGGSRLDARAAYAFVRDTIGTPPSRVAIFGHSLGSAIGAELAAETRPAALLLQSPFTSARAMARFILTPPVIRAIWPVISRVHFDTEASVRVLDAPVHVAHGDRDLVVPVFMGRAVHAAARVPGRLLIARGAGHNDVAGVGGAYWAWLAGALPAGGSAGP